MSFKQDNTFSQYMTHSFKDNSIKDNDLGATISQGEMYAENNNEKESADMSLCGILLRKNEVYIVADSRSTGAIGYTDDYQKIVVVPETNIAVVSTGRNIFNGKNLFELVNGLKARTENEIFYELKEKMDENSCLYIAGKFNSGEIGMIDNNGNKITILKQDVHNFYCLGREPYINIAQMLVNNNKTIVSYSQLLCNMLTQIKILNEPFDNTIGGPIQMVRITPEKAEWVDGFKPDFIK